MISLPILLEEICRPILGLYKSLTGTWMWKLWLRPRYSQKRNTEVGFSLQCGSKYLNINPPVWAVALWRAGGCGGGLCAAPLAGELQALLARRLEPAEHPAGKESSRLLLSLVLGAQSRLFLQSSELGSPTPSPAQESVSPPLVPEGGGGTRLRERGWGVPVRTDVL